VLEVNRCYGLMCIGTGGIHAVRSILGIGVVNLGKRR
jgi:hypothetical protein